MEGKFVGSFNKNKNLVEWKKLNEEYGYALEPIKSIYDGVADRIISIVGKKEKYNVQDAIKFFRLYYYAYPIRLADYYDHVGGPYCACVTEAYRTEHCIKQDNDIDGLNKGVGYGGQYCYISDENNINLCENSVTLVIPLAYNDVLRNRYPKYFEQNNEVNNVIVVIGSFDKDNINSMKVILGETELQELEHVLEFFRINS